MQAAPGAPLVVIESELLLHLLVRLLAAPARLDRAGELAQRGRDRVPLRPPGRGLLRRRQAHVGGIDLLRGEDPDRPRERACGEPPAELGARAVAGVR